MDEVATNQVDTRPAKENGPDPKWSRIDKIRWHLRNFRAGYRFTSSMVTDMMPELEPKDAYNSLFHMSTTGELERENGMFRVVAIQPPSGKTTSAPKVRVKAKRKSKPRVKDGLLERVGKVGNRTVVRDRSTDQIYALTELK